MIRKLLFWSIPLFLFTACGNDDDDTVPSLTCGPAIELVEVLATVASDRYQIVSATADGLCLELTITASGCFTEEWTAELFTSGEVKESLPTQTSARLLFAINRDGLDCDAFSERSFSFDLTPYLGQTGVLPTILSFSGTEAVVAIE